MTTLKAMPAKEAVEAGAEWTDGQGIDRIITGAPAIAEGEHFIASTAGPARLGWSFKHLNARTIEEAVMHLRDYKGKAKTIAGGTDLLNVLKDRILPVCPEAIINLKTIPGLDHIKMETRGLRVGALAKLSDIAASPVVEHDYGLLAEAARAVASPQIRNMATIGGNLCQDVRCWYYRAPHHIRGRVLCLRKGGALCDARQGDNRYLSIFGAPNGCYAVNLSDVALALVVLNASAKTSKRIIPLENFFTAAPGTVLEHDEILTELHIPSPVPGSKGVYLKFRTRRAIDYAIISVACMLTFDGRICKDARIALGGIAAIPWRARSAEDALKGKTVDTEVAVEAATRAVAGAMPLTMNTFKVPLAKALVKRAILT